MKEVEYKNDTFDSYLGNKTSISASDIKNFFKSPSYYFYKKYEEVKKEPARHFIIGTCVHLLILEPEKFDSQYCVMLRDFDRRKKEDKEAYELFTSKNVGKIVLTKDEFEMIKKMAENALKNKTLLELLKNAHFELSIYTEDPITGLKIKLRPDVISKYKSTITDLKTTKDSSPKEFKWDIINHGYFISAAFYNFFTGKENYLFAALSKEEPYDVVLYQLSDDLLDRGMHIVRMCLDLIAFCYKHNYFPGAGEFEFLKEQYLSDNKLEGYFETLKDNNQILTIS